MAQKAENPFEEYLSTKTVAKLQDISTDTVRREIDAQRLKAYLFRGHYFILKKDYEEWKSRNFKPVTNV